MGNFDVIKHEWPELHADCVRAEASLTNDPRTACFYARRVAEQLVEFLFDLQRLARPYRTDLAALINDDAFVRLTGPAIRAKFDLIRKVGNRAVHATQPIAPNLALQVLRDLHHVVLWAAHRFSSTPGRVPVHAPFDPQLAAKAAPLSRAEVQRLAQKFAEQDEQHRRALAEHEALARERDAEIAELRAKVEAAQAAQAAQGSLADRFDRDLNEADTRLFGIDSDLHEAGWPLDHEHDREFAVVGMPDPMGTLTGNGRVDYVLWGADGLPLALIEAKRTSASPAHGQHQAKLYADALEQRYGRRPVIYLSNGDERWLWDDAAGYPPRPVEGYMTRDELERCIRRRTTRQTLASAPVNETIAGRDYQIRAIRAVGASFDAKRRAALLVMATGAGKTRTAAALIEQLMQQGWARRVLFLADRTALVTQAVNAFKQHLPNVPVVNLAADRTGEGRLYVSTHQSMLNLINEQTGDGRRRFGAGFFDLVIIDEAHRSVYQKYGANLTWFDALLLGLTATPKDDIDHNTYALFDLEDGVPTDAYGLDEAIRDGHLVPPRGIAIPTGFVRHGVRYDDLSDDERERWDALDWGDDDTPTEVDAEAVNRVLFNAHTVDLVLGSLMQHGIKVADGDRLGKTIIFAKNQRHAEFIQRRFDAQYPEYGGAFAQVITHAIVNSQHLIDEFDQTEKNPHIAISVDMLDTGIDVHDVVNLVFFKPVRSKSKFWQMIGRGTRRRPDLFGPGRDKTEFLVFDCCANLEFFNQPVAEARGSVQRSLNQRIFEHRLALVRAIDAEAAERGAADHGAERGAEPAGGGDRVHPDAPLADLRRGTASLLHEYVSGMTPDNVLVRPHRGFVAKFAEPGAWQRPIDDGDAARLVSDVAGLPTSGADRDETAKAFDLLVLRRQVAQIEGDGPDALKYGERIRDVAAQLREKTTIPLIAAEVELLDDVASDEWWVDVTLPMLEHVRRRLRGLAGFIERTTSNPVYTDFRDTIAEPTEVELAHVTPGTDWARFTEKARSFLREHENELVIERLRRNRALTSVDLQWVERFMIDAGVGEQADLEAAAAENRGLGLFIRRMVGMSRPDVAEMFGDYLRGGTHTATQIRYVNLIVDELTRNGQMQPERLYEQPFTTVASAGPDELFRDAEVSDLITRVDEVRRRAAPSGGA